MLITTGAATLGLAFCEGLRIYRCIRLDKKIIPNIGFSKKLSLYIYIGVMIVFFLTSIFVTYAFAIVDVLQAFLLGFAVPSGAHLAAGGARRGQDIDDLVSEEDPKQISVGRRLRYWFHDFAD